LNSGSAAGTGASELVMSLFGFFSHYSETIRWFIAPRYHPERHYMRGPGPACAKRHKSRMS
jgi:hypothetical protein